jgi:hypothetical protein
VDGSEFVDADAADTRGTFGKSTLLLAAESATLGELLNPTYTSIQLASNASSSSSSSFLSSCKYAGDLLSPSRTD